MSIQSPVGTLDIKNATLRVGKLEVSNIQGVDTALNVTRANSVLIYDDQASTTTFTGFTSTPEVRDTVSGYLDVADGYVYWGQKLPNAWVMDFEVDIRSGTNPGPLYANVFSTTNTGGDGYSFTFNDNNDKISLYYDGTLLTEATVTGLFTATENWQKVAINYERGMIAISLGGSRKFYYKDIERETPYVNGEYTNFSSASMDGRKIRNLRIVNGEKWMYTGESNIAYTQGSVGIGVSDPRYTLDVSGNANVGVLTVTSISGDGSALYGIRSSNVSDFTSNVTRISSLETDLGSNVTRIETLETDLGSNVTRIETLETDLGSNVTRIETLETDLGSNVTRIETLETDLGSNVTRIETLETDLGSNVTRIETLETDLGSNVTRIETLETDLGSNVTRITNLESGDLTIGGEKTFSSNLEVGTANLFVDTTTGNVGVGTTEPSAVLDVRGVGRFEGVHSGNTSLRFYRIGGTFPNPVAVVNVSMPSEFTAGDTILHLSGCTFNTNGDRIPWHVSDANWKVDLYYDYPNNRISVYNPGTSNASRTFEILIITT